MIQGRAEQVREAKQRIDLNAADTTLPSITFKDFPMRESFGTCITFNCPTPRVLRFVHLRMVAPISLPLTRLLAVDPIIVESFVLKRIATFNTFTLYL